MPSSTAEPGATRLLALLTLANLLNYVDRQILFAMFPEVQRDLGLADSELGLLGSAFIVVYMLVTPLAGSAGDRWSRVRTVAAGLAIWSLATMLAGVASGFVSLLLARSIVGIGEACYAPLGSAMIGDVYPAERRGWSLSVFNLAVPVGSAFGYILGGLLAARFGWRAAFFLVGAPGLAVAGALLWLREPARGAADEPAAAHALAGRIGDLARDPLFVTTSLSMAALTFVLGALAAWMPTFLVRVHGLSTSAAGATFGIVTAATGVIGTMLGGWLGDLLLERDRRGHLLVSAAGLLLSVPATAVAIYADSPPVFWAATAIAEVLVFLNVGPLNAVILGAAAPGIRATAVAVNILAIHVLGDALSPAAVGFVSDRYGLRVAMALMPPMLLVSAVLCLAAGRHVRPRVGTT